MGYLGLLRRRPVLVLWISGALSILGDRLYGLAVMWVVYVSTGSAAWMGLVAVVESLPYILLGTFGGRLVGWFSSFGALSWMDAGRAVMVGLIPLVWSPDRTGVVLLLVLVFLLGLFGAAFDPNLGALTPTLVGPEQVRQVTALLDLTTRVAAIAGPGCVGLLLLVMTEVQLFAVDAATFIVSALALWWLRAHARRAAGRVAREGPSGRPAAVDAMPLLRREPKVAAAIGLHGVGLFVAAVSAVGLPAILAVRLGQGAAGYGLMLAAISAGALAGNLLIGNLTVARWLTLYCSAWIVTGVSLVGISAASSLPVLLACGVVSGLATPAAAVTLRTQLARFSVAERLRLLTVDQTVIRSLGTVGMLTLPVAVDAAPAPAFAGAGTFLIMCACAAAVTGRRLAANRRPAVTPARLAAEPAASRAS